MNLSNLRTSNKNSILDKTLTKGKNEVSLSLFALVFSEIVQYSQKSCSSVADLAEKLHSLGYDVGSRLLDLYVFREKNSKRETKLNNMLLFIKTTLWKVKIRKTFRIFWELKKFLFRHFSGRKSTSWSMRTTTSGLITSSKQIPLSTNTFPSPRTKARLIQQFSPLESSKRFSRCPDSPARSPRITTKERLTCASSKTL